MSSSNMFQGIVASDAEAEITGDFRAGAKALSPLLPPTVYIRLAKDASREMPKRSGGPQPPLDPGQGKIPDQLKNTQDIGRIPFLNKGVFFLKEHYAICWLYKTIAGVAVTTQVITLRL